MNFSTHTLETSSPTCFTGRNIIMLGKVEQKISDAGVKKKKKKGQTKAGNDCSYYLIQTFLNRNLTRKLLNITSFFKMERGRAADSLW